MLLFALLIRLVNQDPAKSQGLGIAGAEHLWVQFFVGARRGSDSRTGHHKQPKLNDEKVNKHPGLLHEGGLIVARISFSLTLALGVYRTVGMSPFFGSSLFWTPSDFPVGSAQPSFGRFPKST